MEIVTAQDVLLTMDEYMRIAWGLSWASMKPRDNRRYIAVRRAAAHVAFCLYCNVSPWEAAKTLPRDKASIYHYFDNYEGDKELRQLTSCLLSFLENTLGKNKNISTQNNTIMFRATISGNLGRDAEIKTINARNYVTFTLAVKDRKDAQAQATWVRVMQYAAGDASNYLKVLKKGASVVVAGRLVVGVYDNHPDITLWADAADIMKYSDALLTRDAVAAADRRQAMAAEDLEPKSDDLPF